MRRIKFSIDPELKAELEQQAAREDSSESRIIRRALRIELQKRRPRAPAETRDAGGVS